MMLEAILSGMTGGGGRYQPAQKRCNGVCDVLGEIVERGAHLREPMRDRVRSWA